MTLRIGINPRSRIDEVLPDPGAGTTAAAVLSHAPAAGNAGVDRSRVVPGDPAALVAALVASCAHCFAHIHLQDMRRDVMAKAGTAGLSANSALRGGRFIIPGDGVVGFAPIAASLASGRYSGRLLAGAEQDAALAPPATTVARAFSIVSGSVMARNAAMT